MSRKQVIDALNDMRQRGEISLSDAGGYLYLYNEGKVDLDGLTTDNASHVLSTISDEDLEESKGKLAKVASER